MDALPSDRLMSDEELAVLCAPPVEQLDALVANGDLEAAKERFRDLEAGFRSLPRLYRRWIAATQGFLYERFGLDGLAAATGIEAVARRGALVGLVTEDIDDVAFAPDDGAKIGGSNVAQPRPASRALQSYVELLDRADVDGARQSWLRYEGALARVHDIYVAWQTDLLTKIYEAYGVDILEECLRNAGERVFLDGMGVDVVPPPVERVRRQAFALHGHTAIFQIREDDEKFTVTMDPCGSCGRQVREGWLKPPINLPVIQEKHPLGFLRPGAFTVYQAHIAAVHHLVPIEKFGVPWPPVRCSGTSGGVCEFFFYKDPSIAPEEFYEQVGLRRPE